MKLHTVCSFSLDGLFESVLYAGSDGEKAAATFHEARESGDYAGKKIGYVRNAIFSKRCTCAGESAPAEKVEEKAEVKSEDKPKAKRGRPPKAKSESAPASFEESEAAQGVAQMRARDDAGEGEESGEDFSAGVGAEE